MRKSKTSSPTKIKKNKTSEVLTATKKQEPTTKQLHDKIYKPLVPKAVRKHTTSAPAKTPKIHPAAKKDH